MFQQMEPAKQAKVIREFQKQSSQMDMTVSISFGFLYDLIFYNWTSSTPNLWSAWHFT